MSSKVRGSAEKRLLSAGRRLFAEFGVAGLSTDRLAQEASVSKGSLYKHFGGKSELFAAIIDEDSRAFDIDPDTELQSLEHFIKEIVEFGFALTRLLARTDIQNMTRAMINHAPSDPETAELFFERAIGSARSKLSVILRKGIQKGYIGNTIPPKRIAGYLLSLWEGIDHYRHHLQLKERPSPLTRAQVEECTRRILGLPDARSSED
ncbi:MAG: TetR/AcrR family transcriptional regulator [Myxococcota bacterium]